MIDYGTRQTDLAVRRAEWRLSRVYRQAQRDIDEKLKDWQKRHEEREAKYRQQVKDGKITQADFDAWMRGQVFQEKQWLARRDEIDAILLNADKVAANIVNEGKLGVFADNANYIGYDLEHSAGINTGFTLYDQATVARLVKSDPQILPKAREGVKKDKAYSYYNKLMNSAITQGIVQGESIPQIAKRIARTTGESSYKSAVRNARTAFTGAQNAGRIEGLHQAQRLGINVKKKWMATLDNRTRDAHAELDGQIRDIDEPFDSELGPIDYPGDPTADPGNIWNCRCTLVYVYPDYPNDMQRRDNETGEIVEDMTYREWEEMKQGEAPKPEQNDDNEQIRQPESTGIESLRSVAQASTDKYDFWTNLDEDQQAVFMASGMNLDDAYNLLHQGAVASEWKAPNAGGPESFAIAHDFSNADIRFNLVTPRSDGWMADANQAGVINIRKDGLGEDWEFIIAHEAGHQLADYSPEIQQTILLNPGNVFGRYNTRLMAFDGVYGEYNPEEAFATCVSNYVRHPSEFSKKYPDAYKAIDELFEASPSALDYVRRIMSEYERVFL